MSENDTPPVKSIKIYQEKGALFRVIHADGVWGSLAVNNNIHLTFFSERQPIPKAIYFALDEKGFATREMMEKREGKEGSFRELEVDVVLSTDAAKAVRSVLDHYIEAAETRLKDFKTADNTK